ncbi:MAG: DUF2330 domain-containing protein [Planctomycetes bacterium]|nr:DUF2330 domain-containing protein [Planctomycetota bacterium]
MFSFRNVLAAGAVTAAVAFGSLFVANTQTVQGCLHPPREFEYPIKAGAQKGLVMFADGHETMVLRPSYKVEGEGLKVKNDAVEGFTTLAWVVPVPNLPDSYKEGEEKLFDKLATFTKPYEEFAANSSREDSPRARGGKSKQGAEFLEEVKVGDYTIQPVKAHGEIGGVELKGWLKDNGFGALEDDVLKYYLDNDYYWLAVKLQRDEGLPKDGQVKPLQISFKTDAPVYPIKINQGKGSFDLELWVITGKELDLDKSRKFGLTTVEQNDGLMGQSNRETKYESLPEEVRKAADANDKLKSLKEGKLYCYRFFGAGLDGKTDLSKLDKDLSFEFKPEPKEEKNETKKD